MDISIAQSIKLAIVSATGLSKDALHIYVGMAVYLTLIVGIPRFRPYLGWLVVFIIACAGEWVDRLESRNRRRKLPAGFCSCIQVCRS